MNRENYSKIIKENKDITMGEIMSKFECPECWLARIKRCKNQKHLPICVGTLNLAIDLWNDGNG